MSLIDKITSSQIRTDIPEFRVGDTIRVGVKITEKDSKGTRHYSTSLGRGWANQPRQHGPDD